MDYLIVKWVHIVSSTLLFGTGIGTAFYMLVTTLHRDVRATAVVTRFVVLADWLFTTPTAIIQPATGAWLVHRAGYPWHSRWLMWTTGLYILAGACWLPVVWLQIRLKQLAAEADAAGQPLPRLYWRYFWTWFTLGFPAFAAFLVIFWLMAAKPA